MSSLMELLIQIMLDLLDSCVRSPVRSQKALLAQPSQTSLGADEQKEDGGRQSLKCSSTRAHFPCKLS